MTNLTSILLIHLVLATLCAYLAQTWKGRSPVVWFVIGFLIQVLGLVILACMPKRPLEAPRNA